jgi:hypothetical protein
LQNRRQQHLVGAEVGEAVFISAEQAVHVRGAAPPVADDEDRLSHLDSTKARKEHVVEGERDEARGSEEREAREDTAQEECTPWPKGLKGHLPQDEEPGAKVEVHGAC